MNFTVDSIDYEMAVSVIDGSPPTFKVQLIDGHTNTYEGTGDTLSEATTAAVAAATAPPE